MMVEEVITFDPLAGSITEASHSCALDHVRRGRKRCESAGVRLYHPAQEGTQAKRRHGAAGEDHAQKVVGSEHPHAE